MRNCRIILQSPKLFDYLHEDTAPYQPFSLLFVGHKNSTIYIVTSNLLHLHVKSESRDLSLGEFPFGLAQRTHFDASLQNARRWPGTRMSNAVLSVPIVCSDFSLSNSCYMARQILCVNLVKNRSFVRLPISRN